MAPSPRRWAARSLGTLALSSLWAPRAHAQTTDTPVAVAPSADGDLGAWLVDCPLPATGSARARDASQALDAPWPTSPPGRPPKGAGDGRAVRLARVSGRGLDLRATCGASSHQVGYATTWIDVEREGVHTLSVGADDAFALSVDGVERLRRATLSAYQDDSDRVALTLTRGRHEVRVKVYQRSGAWRFRVRALGDDGLSAAPGVTLAMPALPAASFDRLVEAMAQVDVVRAVDRGAPSPRFRPRVDVSFPLGAPAGRDIALALEVAVPSRAPVRLDPGSMRAGSADPLEREVLLPSLDASVPATVQVSVARVAFVRRVEPAAALASAVATASRAIDSRCGEPRLRDACASIVHLRDRLEASIRHGDGDAAALADEARELSARGGDLARGLDPYRESTGPMRRAFWSAVDGEPSEFGLYVPPTYRADDAKRYPLVVVLHGLHGRPMAMLRYAFGFDDEKLDPLFKDRHMPPLPQREAFVVTPSAHGDAFYRELGERDVTDLVAWMRAHYPIDESRISITGASMGGTGAAAIALHHPGAFSAAAPLCGYHSLHLRHDVRGATLSPWERFLVDARSNTEWAANGVRLPLWIVHGTQDLPTANSDVLIARYEQLGFPLTHQHPPLGHNVWQHVYGDLHGLDWLTAKRADLHPREVRLRSATPRFAVDRWLRVVAFERYDRWAEASARAVAPERIVASTTNVSEIALERDATLVGDRVSLEIDGQTLSLPDGARWSLHRRGGAWALGARPVDGLRKSPALSGPITDAFHGPLVFVYSTESAAEAHAARLVARDWARVAPGVHVRHRVMSDADFLARGEPLDGERGLVLVGRGNRVADALAARSRRAWPLTIDGRGVSTGSARFDGPAVGAAFVFPNPLRESQYVVIVAGATPQATARALSLPRLLPDVVVYDEDVAPTMRRTVLGPGKLRAAAFFDDRWRLP